MNHVRQQMPQQTHLRGTPPILVGTARRHPEDMPPRGSRQLPRKLRADAPARQGRAVQRGFGQFLAAQQIRIGEHRAGRHRQQPRYAQVRGKVLDVLALEVRQRSAVAVEPAEAIVGRSPMRVDNEQLAALQLADVVDQRHCRRPCIGVERRLVQRRDDALDRIARGVEDRGSQVQSSVARCAKRNRSGTMPGLKPSHGLVDVLPIHRGAGSYPLPN